MVTERLMQANQLQLITVILRSLVTRNQNTYTAQESVQAGKILTSMYSSKEWANALCGDLVIWLFQCTVVLKSCMQTRLIIGLLIIQMQNILTHMQVTLQEQLVVSAQVVITFILNQNTF